MTYTINNTLVINTNSAIVHESFPQSAESIASTEVKITASDGVDYDYFGWSVAVGSGRIVVGARFDDSSKGSAYVYDLTGTLIKKITASDGATGDYFGWSVAVGSGRIVVGATFDDSNRGSAYVYDLTGTLIKKITAYDGAANDNFGNSIAVGSGRIVIGASGDESGKGSAYVYDLNGNLITKITASDGATGDNFGGHIAVGSGRIVIGSQADDDKGSNSGSAYVYDLNGNYITKITASDGTTGDYFGAAVAVGSGRIVIGAIGDDSSKGSSYVYDLNGNFITKITASDGVGYDNFGYSVAVGSGKIVVGSPYDDDKGDSSGSAYVYDLNGNYITKITASDGATGDNFGYSVAVASDKVVVGAFIANSTKGAVYTYSLSQDHNTYWDTVLDTYSII